MRAPRPAGRLKWFLARPLLLTLAATFSLSFLLLLHHQAAVLRRRHRQPATQRQWQLQATTNNNDQQQQQWPAAQQITISPAPCQYGIPGACYAVETSAPEQEAGAGANARLPMPPGRRSGPRHFPQRGAAPPAGFNLSDFRAWQQERAKVGIQPRQECWAYAHSHEEPYSDHFRWRGAPEPLGSDGGFGGGGGAPRAFWQWQRPISRGMFEAAAADMWPRCVHCMDVMRYRIRRQRLYVARTPKPRQLHDHRLVAEEMLQVMLTLFEVSDMEFLLHFGDGCTPGLPVIGWNVCRQHADAGFTMPSYSMWTSALGPTQMEAYHACLEQSYPLNKGRKLLAVWRGSSTDPRLVNITKDNYGRSARVRLHVLGRAHAHVVDAALTGCSNCDEDVVRQAVNGTGTAVEMEGMNSYCAIIDVDGNGWSDRFGQLVHYHTPLLKLASNHTAFFEHLLFADLSIQRFHPDLSDLVAKATAMVQDCAAAASGDASARQRRRAMVRNVQAVARLMTDHVSLAESMAYTLLVYRNFTAAWQDALEAPGGSAAAEDAPEGFEAVMSYCCVSTRLPERFAAAVNARQGIPG